MGDDLTDFQWHVADSGYKVIYAEAMGLGRLDKSGAFITTGNPSEIPYSAKRYFPLRMFPALFKEFAELQTTKDSILSFANKYGMLGGTAAVMIGVADPAKPSSKVPGHGEPLGMWIREIADVLETASLSEAVRASDSKALRRLIHWENGGVYYNSDLYHSAIATPDHAERLSRFRDPYLDPARYRLQVTINKKLGENAARARLLWDQDEHTLKLRLVPSSLLGCMWLQLANAIAGSKEFRQCPECHTWFDASPHAARRDKKFCNPSCKAAAHRKTTANSKAGVDLGVELPSKPIKKHRKARKA